MDPAGQAPPYRALGEESQGGDCLAEGISKCSFIAGFATITRAARLTSWGDLPGSFSGLVGAGWSTGNFIAAQREAVGPGGRLTAES